ncbi:AlpA family phage regulatory protein [Methylocystis sp. H4A]|uniref:helix-turn-helix transcriptional regulator n=1 Tax=Methylocystis sp. H4A TaxID=2785788 RepID=UPI0018C3060C|nr:AlpA family phage regulatory protein [Methylocystis sp. H4A]MBG0802114.1 AlpA family phage regulatory protein [Methylocystis sp. H4A]
MTDTETPILISVAGAAKLTSLSRTAIHRYRREGRFPEPVPLGERRIAFRRADVIAWIEARIADGRARRVAE